MVSGSLVGGSSISKHLALIAISPSQKGMDVTKTSVVTWTYINNLTQVQSLRLSQSNSGKVKAPHGHGHFRKVKATQGKSKQKKANPHGHGHFSKVQEKDEK